MKTRMLTILLLAALLLPVLSGCNLRSTAARLDAVEDKLERQLDAAEDRIESAIAPDTAAPAPAPSAALTEAEAKAIALEHAGFTEDQVSGLRVEYEIDDGIPEYEVDFYQDRWEYDYSIHAETGEILSYERDD